MRCFGKLLATLACLLPFAAKLLAQTPGSGTVALSGTLQGPIYPCGRRSCVTYDSGQIQITVADFTVVANYGHVISEKTPTQLATDRQSFTTLPKSVACC